MTDIIKYDMTDIWATAGDVVAPDSAKIRAGWGVEVVPRQWWNWFENRQDQNIAYILQKGFPEWDATTEYIINKSYVQRNGLVYKATATTTGVDPAGLVSWVRVFADYSASSDALGGITPVANNIPYFTSSTAGGQFPSTAYGRGASNLANISAALTYFGAQAANVNLTALSGLTGVANALPYFNGGSTMTTTTLTAYGRSLIDDADAATARATLEVDSAANVTAALNAGLATRQPLSSTLTVLSSVTPFVNKVPYFTGSGTADTTDLTSYARSLLDDTDAGSARNTLGLGTAATATITTSRYDTTSGSLLKVGDFGLGQTAASPTADLNTLRAAGFYSIDGNTLNKPSQTGSGGTVVHTTWDVNTNQQIALQNSRIWVRQGGVSGGWSNWSEVVTGVPSAVGRALMDSASTSAARAVLELGTAAVATTTTSTTDSTAGRVLRVGDFGFGSQGVVVGDINALGNTGNGFYKLTTPYTGGPLAGTSCTVIHQTFDNERTQIATAEGGATVRTFIRKYVGGTGSWAPWIEIVTGAPTALGRSLMDAPNAATARSLIGSDVADNLTSGTVPLARIPTNLTGVNASTATALQTARTIQGVSFNGTANIVLPVVSQDSATGAASIPAGATGSRPGSPSNGMFRYNTDTAQFEGYQGGLWSAVGGSGIGSAQTWQDVTSFRTLNTTYTNLTGKPVGISVTPNVAQAGTLTITVGGLVVSTKSHNNMAAGGVFSAEAIIPVGSTWSVSMTGLTINKWLELRA